MESSYKHLPSNSEDDDADEITDKTYDKHENDADSEASDEKSPLIKNTYHHTHPHAPGTRKICPTCHGKGKLSQSDADKVVALIPAGDKRLKPHRTKLYMTLTTIFFILAACILVFFLWPRNITVHVDYARSVQINIPTSIIDVNATFIDVEIRLIINNENFLGANITAIDVGVTYNKVYKCITDVYDFQPVVVQRGVPQNVTFVLRQSFMEPAQKSLQKACDGGWNWHILDYFDFSLNTSMSLHPTQVLGKAHWAYILCYNSTAPMIL